MTERSRRAERGGTATATGEPARPQAPATTDAGKLAQLVAQYGCGPVQLTGGESALYERHLTFAPLQETLLVKDHYIHLADLASYLEADRRLIELYDDQDAWAERAIRNIAASGRFSSDRTTEYANEIWNAKPCPIS